MAKYWKTKDGRHILLTDMSKSHLENTVNYIKRRQSVFNTFLEDVTALHYLEEELNTRGQ